MCCQMRGNHTRMGKKLAWALRLNYLLAIGRRSLLMLSLLSGLLSGEVLATGAVAVIYPEVKEPYNQIFINITNGIEQRYPGEVKVLKLGDKVAPDELRAWIRDKQIQGVIALGNQGFTLARQLQAELPVVVGAVSQPAKPPDISGISMTPSALSLLDRLRSIMPRIEEVHLVFLMDRQDWLVGRAQEAATHTGIKLVAHGVKDITDSARQYRKLLDTLNGDTQALWLLSDNSIMDPAIFNEILEIAWHRKLAVFSNRVADVRRGVLFSMYPDNEAMGRSLARLLLAQGETVDPDKQMSLLTDLLTAINLRTAKHLGLYFNKSDEAGFNLIYPIQ
jgi:putative tryptophan/tyrosine transport system substrate-binding protein